MNKNELLALLAKKTNLSKDKCGHVLDTLKETILEVLKKGEDVSLNGFGKFQVVERKMRKCINPITKRFYISKPKKVTQFKSFNSFKYAIK